MRNFKFVEQGISVEATFSRTDREIQLNNGKVRFRKIIQCDLVIDGQKNIIGESVCRPGDRFDVKLGMFVALKDAIRDAGSFDSIKTKLEKIVPWLMIWHNHYKGLRKKMKKIAKNQKVFEEQQIQIDKDNHPELANANNGKEDEPF